MKAFEATGAGIIKFSKIIPLNSGDFLIEYLVQHISEKGKKSHFSLKQFSNVEVDPYPKDTEIEFIGVVRENNYKDKDGNFKTNGLEIIATEIIKKEIFE